MWRKKSSKQEHLISSNKKHCSSMVSSVLSSKGRYSAAFTISSLLQKTHLLLSSLDNFIIQLSCNSSKIPSESIYFPHKTERTCWLSIAEHNSSFVISSSLHTLFFSSMVSMQERMSLGIESNSLFKD